MSAALTVEDLRVSYGDVRALNGATFELGTGTVCGLVGMNGSGKSTLFKAIMGLLTPDSGRVRIGGEPGATARRAQAVGYVPQNEAIDWAFPLDVRDVVMQGRYGKLGLTRRPRRADHLAVDAAIERVGLSELSSRQIGQLSGGQRKRAFVARAIAQEATLLLLDEPFAGVDAVSERSISHLLRELAAEGASVLVSSHNLSTLPELADEVILLMRTVLMHDTPDVVLRPEHLARAFELSGTDSDTVVEPR